MIRIPNGITHRSTNDRFFGLSLSPINPLLSKNIANAQANTGLVTIAVKIQIPAACEQALFLTI